MDDKEVFNPQSGERIAPKKPKKFWKDWRFYVYTIIAILLGIVSVSSMVTACAAINAGVGQSEPVSSEYKVKRNAAITTENGNFSGYSFSVWSLFYNDNATFERNMLRAYCYEVDTSTFTTSLYGAHTISSMGWTSSGVKEAVNTLYNRYKPSGDEIRFLACYFNMSWSADNYGNGEYFTFMFSEENTWSATQLPFMYTNLTGTYTIENLNSNRTVSSGSDFYIMPNGSLNQTYLWMGSNEGPEYPTFQDAPSYYKEMGYNAGYSAGQTAGNSAYYSSGYSDGHSAGYSEGYQAGETAGNSAGYSEGYETGNSAGYSSGYSDGYSAGSSFGSSVGYGSGYASGYEEGVNSSRVFTTIGVNQMYWYDSDLSDGYYGDTYNYFPLLEFTDGEGNPWLVGCEVYFVNMDDDGNAMPDTINVTLYNGSTANSSTRYATLGSGEKDSSGGYYVIPNQYIDFPYAAVNVVHNNSIPRGYFYFKWSTANSPSYQQGYDAGYDLGFTAGVNSAHPDSLTTTLVTVFQQPFNQIYRFFNFNILGINMLGIATGLLSVMIILKVFRKLIK